MEAARWQVCPCPCLSHLLSFDSCPSRLLCLSDSDWACVVAWAPDAALETESVAWVSSICLSDNPTLRPLQSRVLDNSMKHRPVCSRSGWKIWSLSNCSCSAGWVVRGYGPWNPPSDLRNLHSNSHWTCSVCCNVDNARDPWISTWLDVHDEANLGPWSDAPVKVCIHEKAADPTKVSGAFCVSARQTWPGLFGASSAFSVKV
jgi:hypothetical protein